MWTRGTSRPTCRPARSTGVLVWVLVLATASAGVVQYLSAALGIATGASLPELMGRRLGRASRIGYWLQAEAVAMATDLAEVVGGAIALYLLFDLPLLLGGVITGVVSLLLLAVQNRRGPTDLRAGDHRLPADHRDRLRGRPVRRATVGRGRRRGLVPRFDGPTPFCWPPRCSARR